MRLAKVIAFAMVALVVCSTLQAAPEIYAAHSTVAGKTLGEWSAEWWQSVFAIPVYEADGKTLIHPQFDAGLKDGDVLNVNHGRPSSSASVFFLYGSFFGGPIERTVKVAANASIFVPIANSEWSNPDTAAKPDFKDLPGNYTPEELAAYAKLQGDTFTGLAGTLDGESIPDFMSHRESSPPASWTQPANNSITQIFFGENVTDPTPFASDGYYLMLKPLSPGSHTLKFVGSSPDNSATPPLLGPFSVDMTYHLEVSGSAAVPLPAGAWLALSVLPLMAFAARRTKMC